MRKAAMKKPKEINTTDPNEKLGSWLRAGTNKDRWEAEDERNK